MPDQLQQDLNEPLQEQDRCKDHGSRFKTRVKRQIFLPYEITFLLRKKMRSDQAFCHQKQPEQKCNYTKKQKRMEQKTFQDLSVSKRKAGSSKPAARAVIPRDPSEDAKPPAVNPVKHAMTKQKASGNAEAQCDPS